MEEFSKPKILYSEIVRSPKFFLDNKCNFFPEATTFILSGTCEDLEFLNNFLNSDISALLFKLFYAGGGLGDAGIRYKKTFFENLPIPRKSTNAIFFKELSNKRKGDTDAISSLILKAYCFSEEEIEYIRNMTKNEIKE